MKTSRVAHKLPTLRLRFTIFLLGSRAERHREDHECLVRRQHSTTKLLLTGQHDRTPVTTKHEKRLYANPLFAVSYGSFQGRPLRSNPLNERNGDVTTAIQLIRFQTEDCEVRAAAQTYCLPLTNSSRRQMESPGAPKANVPRLADCGEGAVRDPCDSSMVVSSGPLVRPAMIDLLGIVS